MNNNITLIPAKKITGNRISKEKNKPKLKVAAYCRVSTDSEEQLGSYETQVNHYKEYISKNEEWELAGIYADEGISGTNTRKRTGFNEMIDDCMNGLIDLVITKSISRFARNTLDCLKYVRQLKEKNIAVIFEKENINTLGASGELLLTIMASLAQQESQSMSQNIQLGYQFRFQNGQVFVNTKNFLGYDKDENGKLVINEEQAKIVRRIFKEFLEGSSFMQIGKGLEKDGLKTVTGGEKWCISSVSNILKNEKYAGDALLQKTITLDFMNKKRIKNDGSKTQYYVTDDHEAIIPRDVFNEVQEEIARRKNLAAGTGGPKGKHSGIYALSGICTCAFCGDKYIRIKVYSTKKVNAVWRCKIRKTKGPEYCESPTVQESDLHLAIVKSLNQVLNNSSEIKSQLITNIEEIIAKDNSDELEEINEKLYDKQSQIAKLLHQRKDYSELLKEIDELNDEKDKIESVFSNNESLKRRINQLDSFIDSTPIEITEYDDKLVRRYIKEIKILGEKHFLILYKAGIETDVTLD